MKYIVGAVNICAVTSILWSLAFYATIIDWRLNGRDAVKMETWGGLKKSKSTTTPVNRQNAYCDFCAGLYLMYFCLLGALWSVFGWDLYYNVCPSYSCSNHMMQKNNIVKNPQLTILKMANIIAKHNLRNYFNCMPQNSMLDNAS